MRLRASLAFACLAAALGHATSSAGQQGDSVSSGRFGFTPLATSAPCVPGGAGTFPKRAAVSTSRRSMSRRSSPAKAMAERSTTGTCMS